MGLTPPPRDPERPQDDPWDANAVRYILGRLPDIETTDRWTRGTLTEHLRGQPRLDSDRIARARAVARECGVECRTDTDQAGGTVHFFRTDAAAPEYPASATERREALRDT